MSSTPTLPSTIDANDPRLTQEEYLYDKWCPCTTDDHARTVIAPIYRNLKENTKQTIIGLWDGCHEEAARRLATCGLRGSVYRKCKKGKKARAHRHTCHIWICEYCGQAKNLLRCWLRTRRYEVRSERQYGIHIRGPLGSDLAGVVSQIMRWLKSTGVPSVARTEVDPRAKFAAVRMVTRSDKSVFRDVVEQLHKITDNAAGYSATSHFESSPMLVLQWMFDSTEAVLDYCGHTRAKAWERNYRKQLLRSAGAFYAPFEDERSKNADEDEFNEVTDGTAAKDCNCGECDGVMVDIPWKERTVQSIEDIEAEYPDGVDWSSCHDPFRIKRKGELTVNSVTTYEDIPTEELETASPPI